MLVHTPSVADSEGNAPLSDELARARADWEEALAERRRLESNHALSDHLERLRQQVVTERSSMSRWERWREERRFRREFG